MKVETLYGTVSQSLLTALGDIRLLVCDVDGVFSDGRIYLGNQGEELKAFHTRDGYGVKALVKNGIDVAVITGRNSHIVQSRMTALDVSHIIQGQENKAQAMQQLTDKLKLASHEVAAIGDDMPDLGMYQYADIRIAVQDAHPFVKKQANWVTTLPGGFGAVREVCDVILQAKGKHQQIHGASV
ncbi:3-deoxy-manno-octulosonate-8-phosphatase KdsC [Alteromonas aestuariivivens]|uniref:3-deoxy-D-manno-octulosonate 8-phosphate phosphatase KdsC n=1 Tax=Alteromonas aestuariivivens TaxID=1938339 RepID=A0A3D8MCZ2_9ALTE|nr:3-deoxy-manno-octulosonate-8-phosphatase KdsC [Alteromonas aestuariivivens]RDV28110.1 3-deoxy-manno-octulosonate-8-phosphatase KdsC [Alteromonas aestuariivivens]